jgi:2',3'-cyclic-nucleotide 2'-phosphodiesterase
LRKEEIDLVVANAENAAGGMGVDIKSAKELLSAGVQVLTSGNHIWKKKEIYPFLDEQESLIRPANFPAGAPGKVGVSGSKMVCAR